MQFDDLNPGDRIIVTTTDGQFLSVVFSAFIRGLGKDRYLAGEDAVDESLVEIPTGEIAHIEQAIYC